MNQLEDNIFEDSYNVQTICVYGESNDTFYSLLKKWIKENKKRKIIFLEEDYKKYQKSKKYIDKYFTFEKIKNIFINNDLKNILKQIAWDNIYLNLKIIKSNKEKRQDIFKKIHEILNEMHMGANLTASLYADFGVKVFENVYSNLLNSDSFILFESLANKFKDIPAIIVGAGPSLNENIHLLKQVYDKALIFGGGSALNILSKNNIRHHFSGYIDQLHFFERFKHNYIFENVFFYMYQMSHHNLSLIHANKVKLSDYGAFLLESWIYDQLDIKQNIFEGGWNVATFLTKIAVFLGCNPICLVGFDLCFKKDRYANGVVKSKNDYELVKTTNINNEEVYTQKDWIIAKKWIEEFVFSNKNIKFINATKSGLKLENVNNLKLSEFLCNLRSNIDLFGYVHSVYEEQTKICIDRQKVINVFKIIKTSFEKCDILCDEYLLEIEKNDIDYNIFRFQKEIVYIYLLDPLWQIWKYVILRDVKNNKLHILINKLIFFKNVISNHQKILGQVI